MTRIRSGEPVIIRRAPRLIRGTADLYFDADTGFYYRSEDLGWKPAASVGSPDPDVYVGDYFDETGTKKLNNPYKRLRRIHNITSSLYLVGEGDFSYAAAIAEQNRDVLVSATSYDDEKRVREYERGGANLGRIRKAGGITLHGVNAMNLKGTASPRRVDVLQWNFPHLGTPGKVTEGSPEFEKFVAEHQQLLSGFFASAHHKVAESGCVKLTYKQVWPYTAWDVDRLAAEHGWRKLGEEEFVPPPGYTHVLTKDTSGEVANTRARTVTYVRDPTAKPQVGVPFQLVAAKLADLGTLEEGKAVDEPRTSAISTSSGREDNGSPSATARTANRPRTPGPSSSAPRHQPSSQQPAPSPSTKARLTPVVLTYEDARIVTITRKGNGYASVKGRRDDVFIPQRLLKDRKVGDKVQVVIGRQRDGRIAVTNLRDPKP